MCSLYAQGWKAHESRKRALSLIKVTVCEWTMTPAAMTNCKARDRKCTLSTPAFHEKAQVIIWLLQRACELRAFLELEAGLCNWTRHFTIGGPTPFQRTLSCARRAKPKITPLSVARGRRGRVIWQAHSLTSKQATTFRR
jgi:hypothetical protein